MYVVKEGSNDVIYIKKPSEEILNNHLWFEISTLPKSNAYTFDYINKCIIENNVEIIEIPNAYQENKLLKAQVQAQTERSDFIEDCIAEMAGVVYNTEETTT